MAQAKSHHPPLAISKDTVFRVIILDGWRVPRPLISQFISGVMDGLDLTVGKHWSGEIILCNLQMISDATSWIVRLFFFPAPGRNPNGLILHNIGGNAKISHLVTVFNIVYRSGRPTVVIGGNTLMHTHTSHSVFKHV